MTRIQGIPEDIGLQENVWELRGMPDEWGGYLTRNFDDIRWEIKIYPANYD